MPFQPTINQRIVIDNVAYGIAEHPAAPGMPYGQEGRQATVYQLVADRSEASKALKVFKSRYRVPSMVMLAEQLGQIAFLPGLAVCRRTVLTARRHQDLLAVHSDLTYAVLMPWIVGPTWMEVMLEGRVLHQEQSLALASSLASVLASMEERRLAHCDLSAPNILLPALATVGHAELRHGPDTSLSDVELVDVEQMYGPNQDRPGTLSSSSPGYAHRTAPQGLWTTTADRFSGAVLLAEILGWCDPKVRSAAWGESYFEPTETQQPCSRYDLLESTLQERYGVQVAGNLRQAWQSETLEDCPTFGEWLVSIMVQMHGVAYPLARNSQTVEEFMARALELERQGNVTEALEHYRQAMDLAPDNSGIAQELKLIVRTLEARRQSAASAPTLAYQIDANRPVVPLNLRPSAYPGVFSNPAAADSATQPDDTAQLFQSAVEAFARREWYKARELASEVTRRQPDYAASGWQAAHLLRESERRIASLRNYPQKRGIGRQGWFVAALLAVLLAVSGTVAWSIGILDGRDAIAPTVSASPAPISGNPQPAIGGAQGPLPTLIATATSTAAPVIAAVPPTDTPKIADTPTLVPMPTDVPLPDASVYTAGSVLSLLEGPDERFAEIDRYGDDTPLTVIGRNKAGDFLYVQTPNDSFGWMSARYLIVNVPAAEIRPVPEPALPTEPPATQPGSVLIEASSFSGGWVRPDGDMTYRQLPATWIYGQGTDYHTLTAQFFADVGPGSSGTLTIKGMDSEDRTDIHEGKSYIRISVNGYVIHEGYNPLPDDFVSNTVQDTKYGTGNWGTYRWNLSPGVLVQGLNVVTIENLEASSVQRNPPFFMLTYAEVEWGR